MVESRSSNLLILARLAFEAAVRNEGDLFALFDTPPPRALAELAQAMAMAR